MGLPFFGPFYRRDFEIKVYGSNFETLRLKEVFEKQWDGNANFPVPFADLLAKVSFHTMQSGDSVQLTHLNIRAFQFNHPGYCLGYRFKSDSGSFVILTDLAPLANNALGAGMKEKLSLNQRAFVQDYYAGLTEFIRGADLVMHDTNFTKAEIQNRRHRGCLKSPKNSWPL